MKCDVVIIGGGPAGSTVACMLAKQGHDVVVFEREKFPRPHVGESLIPYCYPIFEKLGVTQKMEKGFVRKPGVRFVSKEGKYRSTYCFKHVIPAPQNLSFHVLRARFDKVLLDNARENGAKVFEEHYVKSADLDNPQKAVLQVQQPNGEMMEVEAKFLIDATGQDTFLAKKYRTKKKHDDLDRIAFLTHWKGADFSDGINDGLLHILYLSDDKRGWIGLQAVDVDRLSVGVIVDNIYSREAKKKYTEEGKGDWTLACYKDEVMKSPYTRDILKNAEIIQELMVVSNYSYSVTKKYGSNFAMVGDSASFLDPIFATGVYIAMCSAIELAPCVTQIIKGNRQQGETEMAKVYENYDGVIKFVDSFIRLFYDFNNVNLSQVQSHLQGQEVNSEKEIIFSLFHFLMGGDFYYNYQRYQEYLDFIREPKQLARYQHYVMGREHYKETNCPMPFEEVFPMAKVKV